MLCCSSENLESETGLDYFGAEPPPDVVLDSPLFFAVARGVQQAKPGVDIAAAGLMTFFSFVNPAVTTGVMCVADPANCSKGDIAMAVLPIHVIPGGLKHVLDRHTLGGALNLGKSLFGAGEDIKGLIKAAESVNPVKQIGGNMERVVDARRYEEIRGDTGTEIRGRRYGDRLRNPKIDESLCRP